MRNHFVPLTNTEIAFHPLKYIIHVQMKMNFQLGNSFIDTLKWSENGKVP